MSNQSIVVFVSGSSGSGKNTLINAITGQDPTNCQFLVSNTTRTKRPTDRKVGQYKFVTKEQFEEKIYNGDILEYDIYSGNYYGLDKQEIEENSQSGKVLLKDLTVKGVLNCQELLKDKLPIYTVFLTEKKSVLKQRLLLRGEKSIKSRLHVYHNEQKMRSLYDFVITNSLLEKTIENMQAVINTCQNKLDILSNVNNSMINARKIDRFVNLLEKNKKVPPVTVCAIDNRIYIVDGVNQYLASVKANKHLVMQFINDYQTKVLSKEQQDEFLKTIQSYKAK